MTTGPREPLRLPALKCPSPGGKRGRKTSSDFHLNACRQCAWICTSPIKTGSNACTLSCVDMLATHEWESTGSESNMLHMHENNLDDGAMQTLHCNLNLCTDQNDIHRIVNSPKWAPQVPKFKNFEFFHLRTKRSQCAFHSGETSQ